MDRSSLAADSAGGVLAGAAEMRRLAAEIVATVYPWAAGAGVVITTPPLTDGGDPQVTEWPVPCGDALPPVARRAKDLWPDLAAAVLRVYPEATKASLCLTVGRQTAWLPISCGPAGLSPSTPSRSRTVSA